MVLTPPGAVMPASKTEQREREMNDRTVNDLPFTSRTFYSNCHGGL